MSLERFIQFIRENEPVAPGTPNRPMRQMHQNINYLWDVIQAAGLGLTVYARQQTIESSLQIGQPVYYNPLNQRFEGAVANVDTEPETGAFITSDSSQVWGIVAIKHNATLADLLLFGYDDIDISAAIEGGLEENEAVEAGQYYLSAKGVGKLTLQRPPVTVPVLRSDGNGFVFVNPSFVDLLDSHRHYKFELVMEPAGTTTQPATGGIHTITSPDANLPGWLPADHASFDGLAPAGAKFGYNLAAHPSLEGLWPPLPIQSATIELLRPSIYSDAGYTRRVIVWDPPSIGAGAEVTSSFAFPGAQVGDVVSVTAASPDATIIYDGYVSAVDTVVLRGNNVSAGAIDPASGSFQVFVFKDPDAWAATQLAGQALQDLVVLNRYGIWWMSDCYDTVPWPTDYETDTSVSESAVDCPHPAEPRMLVYFTKLSFATDATVVTSLRSVDNRLIITCRDTVKPGSTGDLDIDLDLTFLKGDTNRRGYIAFKELIDNVFHCGPVAEGVYATSTNVILTSPFQTPLDPLLPLGTKQYHGPVGIGVLPQSTQELSSQLVRLDGVTEEHVPVLYLGMPADAPTSFIVKFEVPDDSPAGAFAYRTRIIGRSAGTLPPLVLEYNIITRPPAGLATPIAVAESWTVLAITTTGVLTASNQAVEAESTAITVAPGDTIFFRINRDPTEIGVDDYVGEVGIMNQKGILTAGV